MYFTKTQKKAILFLVTVFSLVIIYHLVKQVLYPKELFDFSQFEEKFDSRRDSIAKVLEEGIPPPDDIDSISSVKSITPSIQNKIININTADKDELTKLPRIGPAIAQRIINYRTQNGKFTTKEDIQNVKGIGEKTYQKLKDLISVD